MHSLIEQRYHEGIDLLRRQKPADAEACLRDAIEGRPDWVEAQYNLGVARAARGNYQEAATAFERALGLQPEFADGHHALANTLRRLGRTDEALSHYREALRLRPGWADVHNSLGLALRSLGDLDGGLAEFRRALQARPEHTEARNNLGVTLSDKGLLHEAAAAYRQVLRLRPSAVDTHNNIGVVLAQLGKRKEAIEHYRKALELRHNYAEAHNNLGNSLRHDGLLAEAEAEMREALRLKPEYAEAFNNLAIILVKQERVDEAIANYHQALRLKPDYPDARKNLGLAYLGKGMLAEGWREYEWRWRTKEMPARKLDRPAWQGEPLEGKTILLYAEQGLGDTIQFIRYASLVAQRGGKVVVECQKALVPLLSRCAGIDRLVAHGEPLPAFDTHAALLSVPGIVGTELTSQCTMGNGQWVMGNGALTINHLPLAIDHCPLTPGPSPPADGGRGEKDSPGQPGQHVGETGESRSAFSNRHMVPYLTAEPERLRRWGEELKGLTGFKIGIAWQGSRSYQDDKFRSVPLALFEPIARVPGTRLFSMQKGYGCEQLAKFRGWSVIDYGKQLDAEGGFLDTAALMKHLDLVITTDTAVAHLAGALGVRVWLALSTAPDWRWLHEREDSPWYPTMRLFRQPRRGDWPAVFARMARELEALPPLENAERYARRGLALLNEGKPAEAIDVLARAIELDPKNAVLHNNRAAAFDRLGNKIDALAGFEEAVRLNPSYADALHNLGNVLRRTGRPAEAEARYRQALLLTPNSADLCNHLGIALLGQGKHGEAEAFFRRALHINPDHAEAHNNLGVLFEQLGKVADAVAEYETSLRLKRDSPDTHKNRALGWLIQGDYARGWAEYEWRWKSPGVAARTFSQPRWDGRLLNGEAVLLWAEQGLGDTIQFVRYARMVQERGGTVFVECPGVLTRLLARCPGIDRVIAQGSPLPEFAYQVPFLSLPAVFQTTVGNVPAEVPYLSAEPGRIQAWDEELARAAGHAASVPGLNGSRVNGQALNGHAGSVPYEMRIGITWQGSQKYQGDAHRSIPLREFAPLARVPGVRLVSLQKGFGSDQLHAVRDTMEVLDFGDRLDADGAFLDTAAIMAHLDLVVTSDTAVAHLAGALGVEVWMAVSMAADWRWMRGRDDSPWYPTMRLFRQRHWGQWGDVFQRMAGELRERRPGLSGPIMVEIAPGELLDKITILEIKRSRVQDATKLGNIHVELGGLLAAQARSVKPSAALERLFQELRAVNAGLWDIEDEKRQCERRQDFGERFIALARSVYLENDRRAHIKREINTLLGARIIEEKSYSSTRSTSVSNPSHGE
jgi:tetratricopeptide (TPR) repeat protein